jgi:hypothetical protein
VPRYKSFLRRIIIEVARRRRTCHHDKRHVIRKDEVSVLIQDGQFSRKVYCRVCAAEMLHLARRKLDQLDTDIKNGRAGTSEEG